MPDDTSEAAPVVVTGAAAHRDTGECDCPYAQASPHRRENCRYHRGDDQGDDDPGASTHGDAG